MPWYKFTANHGPGHQSHSDKYQFYTSPLSKEDKTEEWEEWVAQSGMDDAYGEVKRVRKLPEKEGLYQLERAQDMVKYWRKMVKVLKG